MKKWLSLICCMVTICFMTGCQSEEMKAAIAGFEAVAEIVEHKNNELDSAIQTAEALLAEKSPALDESLISALETAVSECKSAKHIVPELSQKLEEIIAATEEMRAVDYTSTLEKLSENQAALEDSIRRYSLVNAPSEAYVIECLKKVPNIINIATVTEDNDPNGQLNKQGGYTAHVYFSSDLIDQSIFDETSVIENGTDCGGSVEVYSNINDVTRRNEYLATFDGGILASGSHVIVGTVLVRTSDKLKASQQKAVESNIIAALTDNADAISEPLEPAEQTKDKEQETVSKPGSTIPNAAGVYINGNDAIYLNSDGSYRFVCPENEGDWYGTWWQSGKTVYITETFDGWEEGPRTDASTLVNGGLMCGSIYYIKVG